MITLFGVAFVATLSLLVIVWAAPWVAVWLMRWYAKRVTKSVNDFQEQRRQLHAKIATTLTELQEYNQRRKADQSNAQNGVQK